jgi:hypothetical protein
MKTPHILIALLVSAFLTNTVIAQDFTIKGQTVVRSQYVGFDDGLVFYPDGVIQGNITLAHKFGFFLDLWYSSGFNTDWSTDWDDELDYALGWNGKVNNLDLTASITYFDDHSVGSMPYNDVVKSFVRIGMPTNKISEHLNCTPFASYSGYFIPDNYTPFEGGNVFALGFDSGITLTPTLSITSSTSFGWDDGGFGVKPGCIFKHSSTVNIQASKHLTWNILEATIYVPIGNRNMRTEIVWGTGLSWSF